MSRMAGEASIVTPYNRKRSTRVDRRVLVNGRWQRVDPQASKVLSWLRGDAVPLEVRLR